MMNSKMMARGGMAMVMKDGKKVPAFAADGAGKMARGGAVKGKMPAALAKHAAKPASKAHAGLKDGGSTKMARGGDIKMARGGTTKMARGGGIEVKGKTKGTMVKMARGGKTC